MSFFTELKRRNVFRVAIGYGVTAWLLLQVVDLVLENINAPDWVMQVFMLALAIGFPLAVFFAWAFELTPEGVKRESDVDRTRSIAPQTGRRLDRAIILVLTVAVVILVYKQFGEQDGLGEDQVESPPASAVLTQKSAEPAQAKIPAEKEKSIAVLPLVNRSVQAEDAFFAEGLHDELLTQLSRVSALKVISRTSVMGYAGTTKRIPEIAAELGVATLLEGGVQRAGNRVRINVQLIEASTDEHLWAEVYDRELTTDNLFDIQSDITRSIADALQAVLTGEEQQSLDQKTTDNVEAYASYLRGRAESKAYGRQPHEIDRSIGYYQSAIDLDPQFAAAHAALAIDWLERFWVSDRLGDELERARLALNQARALAPELTLTLVAEGYYHYWGSLDYAPAIAAFDRALQKEPGNYLALRGKAYTLRRYGQLGKAIETLDTLISLDPLFAEILVDQGYALLRAGQTKQAVIILKRAITLSEGNEFGRFVRAESQLMLGEIEKAANTLDSTTVRPGRIQGFLSDIKLLIARVQGDQQRIDSIVDNYGLVDTQSLGPVFARAVVYVDRNQQDKLDTLISEMEASLQATRDERPDAESTLLGYVALHGLRKDKAGVTEATKAFYAGAKPDALRLVENRTIPIAYAFAGDSEALLAYLEEMVAQFGPWEFYYFSINPSFDDMRELPRFKALERQYRQWLEQLQ
jgi:TolB-like protein/Tfp pilus assembly protein PilF